MKLVYIALLVGFACHLGTCDPVKPKKVEVSKIERNIIGSINDLLAKIVSAVTSRISKITDDLQRAVEIIIGEIERNSEEAVIQASKIVDSALDAINQVVKIVIELGFDPKECLGTIIETLEGLKDSYVKELGACTTDRIPQLEELLKDGINEIRKVNGQVEDLGEELDACGDDIFCLMSFFAKLTGKLVELPALVTKLGLKYTTEFASISADSVVCTSDVVVELANTVATAKETTVKCLLGLGTVGPSPTPNYF